MAQFIAFDPNVEVSGAVILSFIAALEDDARALLREYGITHVTPTSWHHQQTWLDAFRAISEGDLGRLFDLVKVGTQIPRHAHWPPDIQTAEEALQSINEAYHMNHRGGEIGYYKAVPLEGGGVKMVCENPYPCDFDYGLLYGVAKLYLPKETHVIVEHDPDGPCRKDGDDACIYHISWE